VCKLNNLHNARCNDKDFYCNFIRMIKYMDINARKILGEKPQREYASNEIYIYIYIYIYMERRC